ncbi:hypothetical protein C8R43DRAFT_1160086 [Mycena crocata]|nr:hypothetical protein C8R43DRAFT_1160086 [Mycena crocata]
MFYRHHSMQTCAAQTVAHQTSMVIQNVLLVELEPGNVTDLAKVLARWEWSSTKSLGFISSFRSNLEGTSLRVVAKRLIACAHCRLNGDTAIQLWSSGGRARKPPPVGSDATAARSQTYPPKDQPKTPTDPIASGNPSSTSSGNGSRKKASPGPKFMSAGKSGIFLVRDKNDFTIWTDNLNLSPKRLNLIWPHLITPLLLRMLYILSRGFRFSPCPTPESQRALGVWEAEPDSP